MGLGPGQGLSFSLSSPSPHQQGHNPKRAQSQPQKKKKKIHAGEFPTSYHSLPFSLCRGSFSATGRIARELTLLGTEEEEETIQVWLGRQWRDGTLSLSCNSLLSLIISVSGVLHKGELQGQQLGPNLWLRELRRLPPPPQGGTEEG